MDHCDALSVSDRTCSVLAAAHRTESRPSVQRSRFTPSCTMKIGKGSYLHKISNINVDRSIKVGMIDLIYAFIHLYHTFIHPSNAR